MGFRKKWLIRVGYAQPVHALKLGFTIPINVFDKGLSIAHYGTIVVNAHSKVGQNCRIQECVNLGATGGNSLSPIVGNNVFIGTGAKLIGGITVADGVSIAANAVVVKDILEPNTTWGGIPAKKLSNHSSKDFIDSRVYNSAS